MQELLPDTWRYQEEEQKCCHQRRGQRRGPITDILLWTECYASMVSSKFPDKTPQFMAYLKTIVKAQRTFMGEGWVTYDACFRRKAAITKSLEWGVVDFTLYNETFTGRAKAPPRCRYCLSEHHNVSQLRSGTGTPTSSKYTANRQGSKSEPAAMPAVQYTGRKQVLLPPLQVYASVRRMSRSSPPFQLPEGTSASSKDPTGRVANLSRK